MMSYDCDMLVNQIKCLRDDGSRMTVPDSEAFDLLKHSVRSRGLLLPVFVNSVCEVVAGHYRFLACIALGHKQVPTVMVKDLSEVNYGGGLTMG